MADTPQRTTISLVSQVVAVLAFYLYFGGWTYSHQLRFEFGLSPSTIDTPVYFHIVYAYTVFFQSVLGYLLILCLAGSWFAVARLRFVLVAEIIIVVLLATLPFPLIDALARARAKEVYSSLRAGRANTVRVLPKRDAGTYPEELLKASKEDRLLLLEQTKDRVYVFTQAQPDAKGNWPEATVFTLPLDDVTVAVTLQASR